MAEKWDHKTKKYSSYELPKGCLLYSPDLDKMTVCAQCGKKITFGEGYTSREIHNHIGLGYPVDEDCYKKEFARERKEK